MEQLTEEQSQLYEHLRSQRFVSVMGCAGSGKTTLARMWAEQLARKDLKVLFLCRNPYLADQLQRQLDAVPVAVFAFTTFVKQLIRSDRMPDVFVPRTPAGWQAPWTHYDAPSQSELRRAIDILHRNDQRYEAVIVDEGQDFEASWLEVAESCVSDPEASRFVIFFDDNPRLAPFGPQRSYADIQAPVSLGRSLRCAGEIDTLVRKLHPGAQQAGLLAGEAGSVKEWNYSSESELVDVLRLALQDAEEFSPNLEDAVVISSESAPSRLSKFAGMVFETPRLRAASSPGRLNWQAAVLRYLQGFGLLESGLSKSASPTVEDVKRVNKFCAAYSAAHRAALSRQPSYLSRQRLSWFMDVYGELRLRWVGAQDLEYNPVDLLKFFSSQGWAASLPAAYKRYRLTPAEELSGRPDNYPVCLVDIPSFKGLEAGAVIFILYNYFAENEDQFLASLYLAFSRARRKLYLITPAGSIDGTSRLIGT